LFVIINCFWHYFSALETFADALYKFINVM